MKRALLINPPIYDFAAFDLWIRPLGLLYVGAVLEAAGWEVELLDCLDRFHPKCPAPPTKTQPGLQRYGCGSFYAQPIPHPPALRDVPRTYQRYGLPRRLVLEDLAARPRPDLIAVTSMMTYWYPGVFEAISLAKEAFPGVPVALGGVYATLCRDHAKARSGADYVLTGPGEEQVLALAEEIGGPIRPVAMDSLRPAYHLMRHVPAVSVLTSFGCPFGCTYCASRLLRRGFVQRDPADVVAEIADLTTRFGTMDVAFYDDALLLNAESHLIPILRALRRIRPELRFHTPNGLHARMIDGALARELRESRFTTLRLSFETASQQRQLDSKRKITNEELQRAIAGLLHVGYAPREIEVYVMMGLPGQALGEVEETLHFVHQSGGWIKIAQYSPIPGTEEFWKACQENPLILDEPLLHNNSIFPASRGPERFLLFRKMKDMANRLNAEFLHAT